MAIGKAKNAIVYLITIFGGRIFYHLFFSLRVSGTRLFPKRGPYIVAANHLSNLDPILVGCFCPPFVSPMAKLELFSTPFMNWFLRSVNAIPLDRSRGDLSAFKAAFHVLETGGSLLMFPEGTRSPDGGFQKANPGVGMLVAKTGAAVVPCRVQGTFDALPKNSKKMRRTRISLTFGAPLTFAPPLPGQSAKEHYQTIGDRIMESIAALQSDKNVG